jgi:hypothetical protein
MESRLRIEHNGAEIFSDSDTKKIIDLFSETKHLGLYLTIGAEIKINSVVYRIKHIDFSIQYANDLNRAHIQTQIVISDID